MALGVSGREWGWGGRSRERRARVGEAPPGDGWETDLATAQPDEDDHKVHSPLAHNNRVADRIRSGRETAR